MKKKLFLLFFIFCSFFYASDTYTEINSSSVISGLVFLGVSSWLIKEACDYYFFKKKVRKILVKKGNLLRLRDFIKDKFYLFILYRDYLFEKEISKEQVPAFFNDKDFIIKNQAYSKEFLQIKRDVYDLLYRVIDILGKDADFRKIVSRIKNKLLFRPSLEEVLFEIFLEKDFFTDYLSYVPEDVGALAVNENAVS
jgi:hypothetical protein